MNIIILIIVTICACVSPFSSPAAGSDYGSFFLRVCIWLLWWIIGGEGAFSVVAFGFDGRPPAGTSFFMPPLGIRRR